MRNNKGSSLIELVIVMTIVLILGLSLSLFIGTSSSANAYGAARKIASDISYAQESAMSHRTHYRLLFSNSPNSYTVQQCAVFGASSCTTWGNINDPSTNGFPFTVVMNSGSYAGVTIDWATGFGGNYIEFSSAGVPMDGNTNASCTAAPCPLTASEAVTLNSVTRSVSVAPNTGATSIY